MNSILQGFILGFILVLPGMSGGTLLVIFGIHEALIRDIVKFNIKPYFPLIGGLLMGILASGVLFAMFFESYRDPTVALLLGCLLASIRAVLNDCPKMNKRYGILMLLGLVMGYFMVGDPVSLVDSGIAVPWWILFVGGAFSSAAMIIPGVPGSSVLILLGIYDTIILYIRDLNLVGLGIFALGSAIGIFLLVKLLEKVYEKYKGAISYYFAGLIIGSSRALLPHTLGAIEVLLFVAGFALVWWWSGVENKAQGSRG
ncbi:DUF368 domain-containing protein [Alkaliphilus transvaalensis]|uniref:DUF368 domain-containing protein n=1 Tax=Alkaliphilus transvaalensis TaxID=114628 RepID=UPI00047D7D3A|nr:DUF368 domain-containing protein [Alkaliphilus transvaalensis]